MPIRVSPPLSPTPKRRPASGRELLSEVERLVRDAQADLARAEQLICDAHSAGVDRNAVLEAVGLVVGFENDTDRLYNNGLAQAWEEYLDD